MCTPRLDSLEHQIELSGDMSGLTFSTAGVPAIAPGCGMPGGPACAVLRAAVELQDRYGLLFVVRLTTDTHTYNTSESSHRRLCATQVLSHCSWPRV
eukprot:SAG25_NODE_122_length_14632_cov_129.472098_10_plen_97_part_00